MLTFHSIIAQENIAYNRMSIETCDCLIQSDHKVTNESLLECVTKTFEEHKAVIDSLVIQKKERQTVDRVPDNWLTSRVKTEYLKFLLGKCEVYKDFFDELLLSKRNAIETKIVDKACSLIKEKEKEKIELTITEVSNAVFEAYEEYKYEILELLDGQSNTSISNMSSRLFSKLKKTCNASYFKPKE